ncbi:collagen alpha-1(IX) chain-like isoform X3 [Diachasmimorpha longicaudata]|uniref:collagen alpha-1(IX) chain-like isoform X3 n=1 Tax=Diachasmimorpha longicaudata TaxID=58733 RepID=UPI0030B911B5
MLLLSSTFPRIRHCCHESAKTLLRFSYIIGSCGATDNASDYGSEDSRYHWKYCLLITINLAAHTGRSIAHLLCPHAIGHTANNNVMRYFIKSIVEEKKSEYHGVPCVGYKPGEDDLQTLFDVISHYRLDFTEKQYPGVSRVRGTTRMQTAYRIDRDANLTLSTRQLFPIGLPQEFSFTSIFRTWKTPRVAWHIFQISNRQHIPEFSVELNPKGRTLDVTIGSYDKHSQTFKFENANIFDTKQWHKLQVSVFHERVDIYVDCNLLGSTELRTWWPIDIDGRITISRTITYPQTVPIDLQWMIVDCDPTKPERERCDELPLIVYEQKKATCNTVCPQGPPGANGTQGPRGFPGYLGPPGLMGLNGLKGEKGEIGMAGMKGDRGESGSRGFPGIPGADGVRGPVGLRGPPGLPGPMFVDGKNFGDKGEPGEKGVRGESGLPGLPGLPGVKGESGDTGLTGLRGLTGLHGEPGSIGPVGLPGQKGEPGRDGIPGLVSGNPGQAGQKGEPGYPGRDGYPGIKGDTGLRGPMGLRGEPGIQGPVGLPGLPGEPGFSGHEGLVSEEEIHSICRRVVREEIHKLMPDPVFSKYGLPGAPGLPGLPGKQGPPGERGFDGLPGSPGLDGSTGAPGDKGDKGERGGDGLSIEGRPGLRGLPGPPGEDGSPGTPGERGKSGRPAHLKFG